MRAVIWRNAVFCAMTILVIYSTQKIVYVIEDAFLATTKIVEFHDIFCTRLVIVGQYISVGIFSVPNV